MLLWLIIIFVPGGCTPVFQPCDVGLQPIFKHHIRLTASDYCISFVTQAIDQGIPHAEICFRLKVQPLHEQTSHWVYNAMEELKQDPELCLRHGHNPKSAIGISPTIS